MLFYTKKIENGLAQLDEEESRHLATVLRRRPGEHIQLTDGQGFIHTAELLEIGKRSAVARILTSLACPPDPAAGLHLAVAPTKNIERFEWFLEKASEIGVGQITPLLCQRGERTTLRPERLEKILVSAMKQCLRGRLPSLNAATPFRKLVETAPATCQKRIPWCAPEPLPHLKNTLAPGLPALVLIGPEGDFTPEEVDFALKNGFQPVSLGSSRLRTETAGVFAAATFALANEPSES